MASRRCGRCRWPAASRVAVTQVKGGITGYDYAPKADALFFTVDATATDEDEFSALRKKFDKPEYGSGKRTVSEVFRLNAKDEKAKPEKLIADKRYIREFAVTQDGKRDRDGLSHRRHGAEVRRREPRGRVGESGEGSSRPPTDVYRAKAASPHAWLEDLAWNPDGTRFAFCAIFDAYPTEIIIGEVKDGKWETSRMPRKEDAQVRGYGSPLQWLSNDELVYLNDSQRGH